MRRNSLLAVPALGAALALTLAAAPAAAYCRTSVCEGDTAQVCTPPSAGDCGTPLAWPNPCVSYSIHEGASSQVSLAGTEAVFEQAFAAWTQADCGGGATPRIQVSYTGPVACDLHEYNQDKGNANIIMYRDDQWPHSGADTVLALTTVTYNLDDGDIYDADMELNSANVRFTTGDTGVDFDLLSIVTHEVGHFLGLSHSPDMEATMNMGYIPGSIALRDLSPDDVAGICAIYPPGEPISSCDPTPRHGFSGECAADQAAEDDGCAVAAPGEPGRGGAGAAATAAIALLIAAARRRRAPRSGRS